MQTLFQHILVPVDFTDKNEVAIAAAVQLARQNGARISLLHVIESIDFAEDDEISRFYDHLRTRSERELETRLAGLAEYDLQCSMETIVDNRVKGIASYAFENDVDLIVISSHPVDPNKRGEGWGTISYQVSALCHCSVMLVKQPVDTL